MKRKHLFAKLFATLLACVVLMTDGSIVSLADDIAMNENCINVKEASELEDDDSVRSEIVSSYAETDDINILDDAVAEVGLNKNWNISDGYYEGGAWYIDADGKLYAEGTATENFNGTKINKINNREVQAWPWLDYFTDIKEAEIKVKGLNSYI